MQNDIEIYLHKTTPEQVCEWLHSVFGVAPERQSSQGSQRTQSFRIAHPDGAIPVLIIVSRSWTSVWFNSAHTPWASDLTCAQAAVAALDTRARCTDGGWHEGDDPDRFLEVTATEVTTILWHDE